MGMEGRSSRPSPPPPVSSPPSSSSSSISAEEIPQRKRARARTQAKGADKPKRPRKEAPRQTQSKDDPADPAAPNAAAKRSSVYRGVTRYASRHLHAVLPHPIHPLIPIATTALLDPNRNSPRALPALSNQSISDFRTICASSISRPLPSVCNSFRREISACMLHSSIQGRKLPVPVCTAAHLFGVLSAKLSLFFLVQNCLFLSVLETFLR